MTEKTTSIILHFLCNYKTYGETSKLIKKSQFWTREQIENYQLNQLKKLLNHSYENVPYYTNLFDQLNFNPGKIKDLKDLQKIPFLTKDIIRLNANNFKANNFPENKFHQGLTGGTTGTPLVFYTETGVSGMKEEAYFRAILGRVGCSNIDKIAYVGMRSGEIESPNKIFSKTILFGRCLILSSFYMTKENLPKYVEKLRKFRPRIIMGYPSALYIFARYAKDNDVESFKSVKTVIFSGEVLFDWQKNVIEDVFNCRVFGIYGDMEQAVLASMCEYSDYYHFFPSYAIVELVDDEGEIVTEEGKTGEIVTTGLTNYIFPLIRYKTGDFAIFTSQKCKCGRNHMMLKRIEGRLQDYIISKNNKLYSVLGFLLYSLVGKYSSNIKEVQIYQEKAGEIILKIVKDENYSESDELNIKKDFQERLGDEFNIDINYVDKITCTPIGKHKFLDQKLSIKMNYLKY